MWLFPTKQVKAKVKTMSKYTTQVRYICEIEAGLTESVGYSRVNEILEQSWDKIFDFDFPMYDDSYRAILCKKILKHYYTREIGLETVGLWKLKLDTRMNEIMPYFNQMYQSAMIEFNPMYDYDLTTEHRGSGIKSDNTKGDVVRTGNENNSVSNSGSYKRNDKGDGTSENANIRTDNGKENSKNIRKHSETPSGGLEGVESGEYLTDATITSNENNRQDISAENVNTKDNYTSQSEASNSNIEIGDKNRNENEIRTESKVVNSIDDYITKIVGKSAGTSYSKLLKEFRQTFLNIDMMIIEELSDLFLNLW